MTLLDLTPRTSRAGRLDTLPVAIVGAGPIGLAAAAHLATRGIDFRIYEVGDDIGASVHSWGHTRLFSPWKHLIDPAAASLLEASGWQAPPASRIPTGAELVSDYLAPLAQLDAIASRTRTSTEVLAVTREGMDRTRTRARAITPFALRLRHADGSIEDVPARAVIDASGTYRTPNRLGSSGLDPLGLTDVTEHVSPALPDVLGRDRARFAGRHTTVVGAGHSAANTLLALVELASVETGTRVTWLIRNSRAARVTTAPDDELVGRAELGGRVEELVRAGAIGLVDGFEIIGTRLRAGESEPVELVGLHDGESVTHRTDEVVNATGFRPDLGMLRELRLDLDEIVEAPRRLAPLIDPNVHSCGTVEPHGFRELTHPEQNFFIVGMKSYGRAPTFLLATGYEQVRSVVAHLAGDSESALRVALTLPATGVCSTDIGSGACCT